MTTPPMPDPDNLPVDECSDEPKLTAEEWEAVVALSGEPGQHAAPEEGTS